jgi:flagellum-specific ATP synthase
MDDFRPAVPPTNELEMLEESISATESDLNVRVGGVVTAVMPGYCRVSGLSQFVKLGESVQLVSGGQTRLGEVVRIDENGASIKTFEPTIDTGLGAIAWRQGPVTISPDVSWKGRIVNALGQPMDDAGPLPQGEFAIST